jgi:bisphosphoglycerate-independent phosphoglycerate mutase (AlkP superfamily)
MNSNVQKINLNASYGLKDIAPTILNLMNLPIPNEMTASALFKRIE